MSSVWRYPFALLGIVFVLIGFALWPRHRAIPVLIYHNISESAVPAESYTVELSLLARELDYLKQHEYTPLSFATAATLAAQGQLPKHPVIITFDDALPGQTLASTLLRSKGMPATFFITSDLIDDNAHLNWRQVRTIASAGFEIGGHSKTHAHLLPLSESELTNEIVGDKARIELELGKPISVFAYPYQERDTRTDALVQTAGYTIVRDAETYDSTVMTNSFDEFLKAI